MGRFSSGFSTRGARVAATFALFTLLGGCGSRDATQGPPPPPVDVIEVAPAPVPVHAEYVGQTAGFRDVEVRARVSGILLRQLYVEGEPVTAGELLFEIDPAPYAAALDQAKGGLAQAQAQLGKASADRKRVIPLLDKGVISRRDYDDTIAAFESARANLQSATARVHEAELNLEYTHVTAPIAGVTSRAAQSEGSLIAAGGSSGLLTTISQFNPLYVNFSYSEQDRLALDRLLRTRELKPPANGKWPARIRLADGSLYAGVGYLNFSDNRVDPRTGTIRARAIFDNTEGHLLPGQFVRILINFGSMGEQLQVPERAIVRSQDERLVMVVNAENVVESRPVKLGHANAGMVVVSEGLQQGERVVVDGLLKARPGTRVAPTTVSPATPAAAAPR